MHFPSSLLAALITTTVIANPVPNAAPKASPHTLHVAPRAAPELITRVSCSTGACKTLLDEASCIFDSTKNPIKLVQCLAKAGGVDSVCPCVACIPDPFGSFLSQPGIC